MKILRENEAAGTGGGQPSKEQELDAILTHVANGTHPNDNKPAEQEAPPAQDDKNEPNTEATPGADDYKAKYESTQTELNAAKAEAARLKELADADPFDGDTELKAIKELKKKGASTDSAIQYLRTDITKMTPLEKKVLSVQLATPGVDKDKIERYVKQQYGLGEFAPRIEKDGEEVADETDGLTRLEIEVAQSGGINEQLEKQKEQLLTQAAKPKSQVEAEHANLQLKQKLTQEWTAKAPEILNSLKAFETKVEGVDAPIKFELKGYEEKVGEYLQKVVEGGYELTPENVEAVKTKILKDALWDNRAEFALEIAKANSGAKEEQHYNDLHNPSAKQVTPGSGKVKKTPQEELDYALANMN